MGVRSGFEQWAVLNLEEFQELSIGWALREEP